MNSPKLRKLGARIKALAIAGAERTESVLRRFYGGVRRKLSPPVSVYRKKDLLTVVNATRIGGQIYLASISESTQRKFVGPAFAASLDGVTLKIANTHIPYADEDTARAAFRQVRRALLPTPWSTWMLRIVGLLLAWMVFKAVFATLIGASAIAGGDPRAQQAETGDLYGVAAAMAADPTYTPPEPEPQAMPGDALGGDLADRIYREATAAAQQTLHEEMPPQLGADVEGLEGFGLEDGPGKNGPGCDPALAFKIDP